MKYLNVTQILALLHKALLPIYSRPNTIISQYAQLDYGLR